MMIMMIITLVNKGESVIKIVSKSQIRGKLVQIRQWGMIYWFAGFSTQIVVLEYFECLLFSVEGGETIVNYVCTKAWTIKCIRQGGICL